MAEPPAQVPADIATLLQIVDGLDQLDLALEQARPSVLARRRGYFTPDEDDRVRQLLLAYRNYRLSTYELINRYRTYQNAGSFDDQLRAFIIGYAAAVTLYSKSQKVIRAYRHEPLVRRKLNEPEPLFGIAPGFFEELLASYTSLNNYTDMVHAEQFWRRHRRDVRRLGIEREPGLDRLCDVITRQRAEVHRHFHDAVEDRVTHRFRMLRDVILRPVDDARSGLQAMAFKALAHLNAPIPPPCFNRETLSFLRPRLRPGDVLLTRTEQKLTSAILPGFWIHAAMYMGSAEDLDGMGLANHSEVQRHWERLRGAGSLGAVIEAISPNVIISPLETALEVDHVAVLRPRVDEAARAEAIVESLRYMGRPYDFEFDFNQTQRIVCTGLIYRSFYNSGAIKFSLVKHLGRYALTCDELCAQALAAESPQAAPTLFNLEVLILQTSDGRPHVIPDAAALAQLRAIQRGLNPRRDLQV